MNFFIRIQQITPSFVGSRVSDKTIRLAEPLGICGEHKEADNELESNYNPSHMTVKQNDPMEFGRIDIRKPLNES
jgi:hypothetical protein